MPARLRGQLHDIVVTPSVADDQHPLPGLYLVDVGPPTSQQMYRADRGHAVADEPSYACPPRPGSGSDAVAEIVCSKVGNEQYEHR
jgi:hypothetical protein